MRSNFLRVVFHLFSAAGFDVPATQPLNILFEQKFMAPFVKTGKHETNPVTSNSQLATYEKNRPFFFDTIKANWNSEAIKTNGDWKFLSSAGIRGKEPMRRQFAPEFHLILPSFEVESGTTLTTAQWRCIKNNWPCGWSFHGVIRENLGSSVASHFNGGFKWFRVTAAMRNVLDKFCNASGF